MSDTWLQLMRDPEPWAAPRPLPAPVETERLIIRPHRRGDGPLLFEAIASDRDSLLPWMPWAHVDHQSEIDSVYYVERVRRAAEDPSCGDFPMAILDKDTGKLVGSTGLVRIRRELREAELGYWVRGSHQGRGVATEAAGGLLSAALRPARNGGWGLRRVIIQTVTANRGSRRVCEKLGLRLEMRMKQERYLAAVGRHTTAGYHDVLGYAVLHDEWDFDAHRARPGIGWPGVAWNEPA